MSFNLTEQDQKLVTQLKMVAVGPAPIGGGYNFRGGEIPFQFPPRIKSDAKSGKWEVIDIVQFEPQVIWMGAGARRISLEITYIVTGHKADGVLWDAQNISKIVKDLRGILYANTADERHPLWQLTLYGHIPTSGGEASTWRTVNVSERPGDTFITTPPGPDEKVGTLPTTYAFRTDITLELEMVTQIQATDQQHQAIFNAVGKPLQAWY